MPGLRSHNHRNARIAWLAVALTALVGCSRASNEASTQTQRQRQTDKEIAEELGQQGWELKRNGAMWNGKFTGSELTSEMLQRLLEFHRFGFLDLSNQQLSPEHVQLISQMEYLFQLDLSGTNLTDADLDTLNACPLLASIDARETQVTPSAAEDWCEARKTNPDIALFVRNGASIKTTKK